MGRPLRGVLVAAVATTTLVAAGVLAGHLYTRHDRHGAPTGSTPASHASPWPLVPAASMSDVLPAPASVHPDPDHQFRVTSGTVIHAQAGARDAADYLAGLLRRSTGYRIPIVPAQRPAPRGISLLLSGADPRVGDQGYRLDVDSSSVVVRARAFAGVFAGVQTLHQLLPADVDATSSRDGPWPVPAGRIVDYPRYEYRGAMLDVSRHFFGVDTVRRYIDELSEYKINYLHLHLSDDQGWRIAIDDWPELTDIGGATEGGGGKGGYYTQDQYRQIVNYAEKHAVTIVPEIDMPGHTNAALHSRPDLTCNGVAPPAYTKIGSPNTALCIGNDHTYSFIDTVIGQLAALTPGPYIHIGGDEAFGVTDSEYKTFIGKVAPIVRSHGKTLLGWDQIVGGTLQTGDVAEDWDTKHDNAALAAATHQGVKLIMAPANHVYLDQKYDKDTELGLHWAGYVDVKDSYRWDPATYLHGGDPSAVLGVEAPLWSETIDTLDDIQYLAFPRLTSAAEIGWSPRPTHDWTAFSHRLAAQAPRWKVQDVNFYHSPQVPWATDDTHPVGQGG